MKRSGFFIRSAMLLSMLVGLTGCHTTRPPLPQKPVVPTRNNNITAVNPAAYPVAYKRYQQRASEGDSVAELNIGRMYSDGRGVPVNDREAIRWFTKSAQRGNVDAEVSLGAVYLFAKGTDRNSKHACKLFRHASLKGDKAGKDFYQHYCA